MWAYNVGHGGCDSSRNIKLVKLQLYTSEINEHASHCDGSITLSDEVRLELASIFSGKCSKCLHIITLVTSFKVKGPTLGNDVLMQKVFVLESVQDWSAIWLLFGGR